MSKLQKFVADLTASKRPPKGSYSPATQLLLADLAEAHQEAGSDPNKIKVIIEKAKMEAYNDFLSESATPITDLIIDAKDAGIHKIAKSAQEGKYDD